MPPLNLFAAHVRVVLLNLFAFAVLLVCVLWTENIKEEDERADPTQPVYFSKDPPAQQMLHYFDFSASVDRHPIHVLPSMPIDRILGLFQSLGLRYVLVSTSKGKLVGIIKKKDLLFWLYDHHLAGTD